MRYMMFLLLTLHCSLLLFAQQMPASIQWQKCLGGSQNESAGKIVKTTDGNFVVAGITSSADGDVAVHTGSSSLWVVKLSNTGQVIWQRFVGTQIGQTALDIKNTPDGGFIVAGSTSAPDPLFTGYHAQSDALIVKLRSDGSVQWAKCYGGAASDGASVVQATKDGGYIFAGQTNSSNGDISSAHGGIDIWVVKLDNSGAIRWQRTYGGSNTDFLFGQSYTTGGALIETTDGGYMLVGSTDSRNGDVSGYHTGFFNDAWVVKLDQTGNIIWQKCLGGSVNDIGNAVIQLKDGTYFLLAFAGSTDGDVTGNHSANGDIWLCRLDAHGTLIEQKCIGGTANEYGAVIKADEDGNYVIGGSASSRDGDVSGMHLNSFGVGTDAWLVKTDSNGMILSQRVFGGSNPEAVNSFEFTSDGEMVFTANTQSGDGGDIGGSHNSNSVTNGLLDIWVVKTGATNSIKGTVFADVNNNGIKDATDYWVNGAMVKSEKQGYIVQSAVINGAFVNKVDTGSFLTTVQPQKPYYANVQAKFSAFTSFLNTDSISFALVPFAGKSDFSVLAYAVSPARPGFFSTCKVRYNNSGTDSLFGRSIAFIKDARANFQPPFPRNSLITGDTLRWNIPVLGPQDTGIVAINFLISAGKFRIGDTVLHKVYADTTRDQDVSGNTVLVRQLVTGSYDPNDKQESNGGFIHTTASGVVQPLTYTVRFQNTGTDTAFSITVRDTLDAILDAGTMQVIDASHPWTLGVKNGQECTWRFQNINLPDSNRNESVSHGYITFSIYPRRRLAPGDTIANRASIFFDFNDGVVTNRHLTVVRQVAPPQMPIVSGLASSYCKNAGIQKGLILNLPSDLNETKVTAILDDTVIVAVMPDSSVLIQPSLLSQGHHLLVVSYRNISGAMADSVSFSVRLPVQPAVTVTADKSFVAGASDIVHVAATKVSGGGPSPQFTFAGDRSFSSVFRPESSDSLLELSASKLAFGSNKVFVRLRTSESCYSSAVATDSVTINRIDGRGLSDPDFPGKLIIVYPNPATDFIRIIGLQTQKSYRLYISDMSGRLTAQIIVKDSNQFNYNISGLSAGQYLLTVYDLNRQRTLGAISFSRL